MDSHSTRRYRGNMASETHAGINLQGLAKTVTEETGDKGAVIISFSREGVRIGTEGLTPEELREALCTAIHYSYVFEDADQ